MCFVCRWTSLLGMGLGIGVVLGACSPTPAKPRHIEVSPIRSLVTPQQARALASTFAGQIVNGDYTAQWDELAPQTQAMWPSEAARTSMLVTKFGPARIVAVTVGAASPQGVWTVPESP